MKKSKRKNRKPAQPTLAGSLTGLIMAHGLGLAADAQTLPAPTPNTGTNAPTQLPGVVVTGERESFKPEAVASPRYTEPLVDIPQTITVVPQTVIEQQGAVTLRDVLRNVTGISIQAGEGGVPAGDNLSIRGFNARTDLFIDGVRDVGGYSRDPFNLEQVEVVKGPASTYSGRGSTGGSINLITKTPAVSPFYSGTFGLGTDDYKRGTFDVNQPLHELGLDSAAFRLNGMWHEAGVPGRDEVEVSRWGVAPSFAYGLGTPTRFTVDYMHLDQDNVPDYGIPWVPANNVPLAAYADKPAPVDFSNYYGIHDRDYEETVTDVVTARIEHGFTDSLRLRNQVRFGRNDRDSLISAPRFAATDSTQINRNLQSRDMVDTILANQADLTWEFATGPLEHALVTSLEYARETSVNHLRAGPPAPLADLFDPDPDAVYDGSVRRTGARNKATADSFAVAAFDTIDLTDQWQLSGGLRWDYFDLDYESRDTNRVSTTIGRSDEMLSWRVGAVYKPLPNGSIYAAYGTSFNPAAEGLTLSTSATAANNVNTDPEESRTYEIGTKWDLFDRRLSVSLALFRTEKTNARTQDPADPADIVVLDGEQRVDGVEIGFAGSITPEWRVFGGYTFLDSEVRKSLDPAEVGNELSNTPKHTLSLWTSYELPWNIEIGAGAQFIDSRFSSTANTREAPSYWLFDAMAAYHINENFSLRLNVYNLADKEYIDRVGGGHFIPGNGRFAMLTAAFRF